MFNITLDTYDHQKIAAVHYQEGHKKAVILAHGFFNNKDVFLFRKIAKEISRQYDVVVFDFRGHGKSSGTFAWTSKEQADLRAAVDYAKAQGYEAIGVMGFSLGAAVSILEAAENQDIKTIIAVAGPSDFWKIDYHFWEPSMWGDLQLNLGFKGRGKRVWPGNPFEAKTTPVSVVSRIAPRPVLFIHGSEDWLIKPRHSRELFDKAREPKRLEVIQGAGHAEKIYDEYPRVFMKLCLDWFHANL